MSNHHVNRFVINHHHRTAIYDYHCKYKIVKIAHICHTITGFLVVYLLSPNVTTVLPYHRIYIYIYISVSTCWLLKQSYVYRHERERERERA